jgi:hypothetical protein
VTDKPEYWRNGQWKGTLVVMGLVAMFPAGIILAYLTGETNYLMLCGVIFLFLS